MINVSLLHREEQGEAWAGLERPEDVDMVELVPNQDMFRVVVVRENNPWLYVRLATSTCKISAYWNHLSSIEVLLEDIWGGIWSNFYWPGAIHQFFIRADKVSLVFLLRSCVALLTSFCHGLAAWWQPNGGKRAPRTLTQDRYATQHGRPGSLTQALMS